MNAGYKLTKSNPKKSANVVSKAFFIWLVKLFRKGIQNGITSINDLYQPMASDNSAMLGNRLERYWTMELETARKKNRNPSLFRALTKTFFNVYMFYGFIFFIQMALLRSFQPVLLSLFVHMFSNDMVRDEHRTLNIYLYGSGLILLIAFIVFVFHHSQLELTRVGMKARIACSTLIYRKSLKLSKKCLGVTASGKIVNLITNDLARFDLVGPYLHIFWITPIQVAILAYFMWEEIQVSAFAGIVAMVVLIIPLQGLMGKFSSFLRNKVAGRTDTRVKLMNELINGIQVVKMYVWEKPFEKVVKSAREREIKMLTYTSYIRGIYNSFGVFTERTTLYCSVICYYLLGNQITADKVFPLAQFFNLLQMTMAIYIPLAVTMGAEALVTIKRLEEVLLLDERKDMIESIHGTKGILLDKVNASWTDDNKTLKNLTAAIPEGLLCAIVGPVGAGKSSILHLLLGELCHDDGTVQVHGDISYASQEPWLFLSSVRQNIIYTREYQRERYRKVVKVCALEKDFELFPKGDKTIVGERGVSLSGGQKARINLARAIYNEADIYLLDDPLSAVDTHVANHLFDECIYKHLQGKTRVLVTHQLQFLKKVDHIIVLNDGLIEAQGTFSQLIEGGSTYLKSLASKQAEDEEKEMKQEEEKKSHIRSPSTVSAISAVSDTASDVNFEEQNVETVTTKGSTAYKKYVSAGANIFMMIVLLFLIIFAQVVTSACDYWLTFWTRSVYSKPTGNNTYLYIYTGLIIGCIFFVSIKAIAYYKVCMSASQTLHDKMFHSLLRAPMRFFDTNPSGRVLNRFSRDMGAMDEILPRVGMETITILSVMCGILVMVAVANYYMIIAAVILGIAYLKIRSWYVLTAKKIKHLEGIAKSPVLSHLSATLHGIVTIRATHSEDVLRREFDEHQDVHTSAWYLTIACMEAVGLWLDIICVVFLACIVYGFIIMEQYFEVDDSSVGLALSQAMILTGMLQYGVRQSTELVSQMTSVERILDYTQIKSEEKPVEEKYVSESWPKVGRVQFVHMYLRYSETEEPVLRDLNFTIAPGEKIGIVGRTGAGKSSIITALFRLAPLEGSILIDGVDTKTIALSDLRDKISIIPQEPVLFSATVRYNLDPFGHFEDKEIYRALEEVELKQAISSLDFVIEECGANFSVGQRQLICLARAILRNNKILVLDEATANVDHRTDALIQATIRRKFASCTVLTVAHRLNTIMDSDKILVMAAGRMMEFDHPYRLLQNTSGFLYKMVLETGPVITEQLFNVAAGTYSKIIRTQVDS